MQTNDSCSPKPSGPLRGVRILDLSTVIAGPWAATLLADLGAEVLKVEMPVVGDALRALTPHKDGVPLWWKVVNRNKKGITLDLRKEESKEIIKRLLPSYDVLVENFRPGTLDRWGFTREWLLEANPKLVVLRMTGFGQTGPYKNMPGFARVFEAMAGFTNLCGMDDGPPVHLGYPIADAIAGLFGAIGIIGALYEQRVNNSNVGQEIDCALTEAMLRVLDFMPIEYDQLKIVRQRSGSTSQYASPGDVYQTKDNRWASISASTQSIYKRLCEALGRKDLIDDPRFKQNQDRLKHRADLDFILREELKKYSLSELSEIFSIHHVGFSPICDVADVFANPQFIDRKVIITVDDEELGPVRMQSVVPLFSRTPGQVHRAGPSLGQHNEEIYSAIGIGLDEQKSLKNDGVI